MWVTIQFGSALLRSTSVGIVISLTNWYKSHSPRRPWWWRWDFRNIGFWFNMDTPDVIIANFLWDPFRCLFEITSERGILAVSPHASRVLYLQMTDAYCKLSCSRACNPVRPPPIWEFVNGSRDLLFRGVSSSNLSINNLLCGLEDLYFPLKCGFFRCYNLFHLSFGQILGNKSIGTYIVGSLRFPMNRKFISTSYHILQAQRSCGQIT